MIFKNFKFLLNLKHLSWTRKRVVNTIVIRRRRRRKIFSNVSSTWRFLGEHIFRIVEVAPSNTRAALSDSCYSKNKKTDISCKLAINWTSSKALIIVLPQRRDSASWRACQRSTGQRVAWLQCRHTKNSGDKKVWRDRKLWIRKKSLRISQI